MIIENNKKKFSRAEITRIIISFVVLAAFLGALIYIVIRFWPYIIGLLKNDENVKNQIIQMFENFGHYAWAILLLCMILQVVFAILPNGIFEVVTGLIYGQAIGVVISLVGTSLGCLLVISLVRLFGKGFASLFVNLDNQNSKFKFLHDEKRCLVLIFGYLFIPGLPKDFIVFLVPFMNVKVYKFLIVNLIARTPSTIVSVFLGDSLMTGNLGLGILLFGIATIIGALCLIFNKKIVNFLEKSEKKESKPSE